MGAFIVDWAGERVDFAGGLVNFEGRGFAQGYDLPVEDVTLEERPLLFGCGAAVLFRRDVFEASGGWDEPTFAYYEDVEFGWRLWMLGHEVWFAPKAVVHHKHHGTSGTESPARRARLRAQRAADDLLAARGRRRCSRCCRPRCSSPPTARCWPRRSAAPTTASSSRGRGTAWRDACTRAW